MSDQTIYFDILTRDHQVATDDKYVMDEYASMLWKNMDEFVESPGRTNVALGRCIHHNTSRTIIIRYFTFRGTFYLCGY